MLRQSLLAPSALLSTQQVTPVQTLSRNFAHQSKPSQPSETQQWLQRLDDGTEVVPSRIVQTTLVGSKDNKRCVGVSSERSSIISSVQCPAQGQFEDTASGFEMPCPSTTDGGNQRLQVLLKGIGFSTYTIDKI